MFDVDYYVRICKVYVMCNKYVVFYICLKVLYFSLNLFGVESNNLNWFIGKCNFVVMFL